jgi:hypothetical protein
VHDAAVGVEFDVQIPNSEHGRGHDMKRSCGSDRQIANFSMFILATSFSHPAHRAARHRAG